MQKLSAERVSAVSGMLAKLSAAFTREITEATTDAYIDALGEYAPASLERATAWLLRHHKSDFMPTPPQIIEAIEDSATSSPVGFGSCPDCDGMGWKTVPRPGGGQWAARCPCKTKVHVP